jgi:hypothetical protein
MDTGWIEDKPSDLHHRKGAKIAKVRNNIFVRGLSGSLGEQFVVKKDKAGRTIISASPTFDENRPFSEAQKQQHEKFRDAAAYAKEAKGNVAYAVKAEDTPMNPYNVAMADFFHAPEVTEIDVSAWHGGIGEVIRIKAIDDVQVTQVNVVITDNAGTVLEQGSAVRAEGLWWNYTTTATASENPRIVAIARDLPGHIAEFNWN